MTETTWDADIAVRETISRQRLLAELLSVTGHQFIGLKTRTAVKMKKGKKADDTLNPLFGRVEKLSRITGSIGFNWTNVVNNAREREGNPEEFTAGPRPWGKRVKGTPIVEHKGSHYLEVKVDHSLDRPVYLIDGVTATADECRALDQFLPKETAGMAIATVVIRTYKLESIIWLNQGGHEYSIKA